MAKNKLKQNDKIVTTVLPKTDGAAVNVYDSETETLLKAYASSIFPKESQGFSLKDSTERGMRAINKEIRMHASDDYYNSLLQIGSKDPSRAFDSYSLDNDTLNWTMWTTLYCESWVFRRAIDKPAQDEANAGFIIKNVSDIDKVKKIYSIYEEHTSDFIELLSWGALYGGAVAVMMFDGISMDDMRNPIDFTKINAHSKHLLRMYVTDRWYGCAPSYGDTVSNFHNIDFGLPRYYNITFADGKTYTIHHSYILRYAHRTAPKFIKNGQLSGWGYAEGAHIINEIMRDDKLKSTIQSLLDKSLIEVIQMPGMRGVFMGGDPATNEQLKKRLEMVQWARNFNSLTFLDKDDVYNPQTAVASSFGSFAQLIEQNMWLISAALEMPGCLYGHLNNGFSGDEGAEDRYAETIYGRCNTYYKPCVRKFLKVMYRIFDIQQDVSFEFKRINDKTVNEAKIDGILKYETLLSNMKRDGYLDDNSAADALRDYIETGSVSIKVSSEEMRKNEAKKAAKNENNGGQPDNPDMGGGMDFGVGGDMDFGSDMGGGMGGGMDESVGATKPEATPAPAPESAPAPAPSPAGDMGESTIS